MLPQKRINYFLKTDYKNLKEGEYDELVEKYFRVTKEDWYDEKKKDSETVETCDGSMTSEFWKLIRKHTMVKGKLEGEFRFKHFVFPRFEIENFWNKKEKKIFGINADFKHTTFTRNAFFRETTFGEDADFSGATFTRHANFMEATFIRNANFPEAMFIGNANFQGATFTKGADFNKVTFTGIANFNEVTFTQSAYFNRVTFTGDTHFSRAVFTISAFFMQTTFTGNINFTYTTFMRFAYFDTAVFPEDKKVLFEYLKGEYDLSLSQIKFTSNTIFREVNFNNPSFLGSDISELIFRDCTWGDGDRIKLRVGKESMYRQLKKNFESSKNWELSGKAYVSEMAERQKRYKNQINWNLFKGWNARLSFCFFKIYEVLGLYTQSFIRPFLWFCASTVIIFPLLVYSDWCVFSNNCEFNQDVLKYSFKNAIPFYRLEDNGFFWWSLFQKLFSTVLLTFFILALRKRFKQ